MSESNALDILILTYDPRAKRGGLPWLSGVKI